MTDVTPFEFAVYDLLSCWGSIRCDARNDTHVHEMRGGKEMDEAYDALVSAWGDRLYDVVQAVENREDHAAQTG